MKKSFSAILVLLLFFAYGQSQTLQNWTVTNPFDHSVFIENKGQFLKEGKGINEKKILYYSRKGDLRLYFYADGMVFRYDSIINTAPSGAKLDEDEIYKYLKSFPVYLKILWVGANPNVQIEAQNEVSEYFTYENPGDKSGCSGIVARAWQNLVYRNIYNGVDVEFFYPEKGGIEYNIIIHPGADISQVKMLYSENSKVKLHAKNVEILSGCANIVDHAPSATDADGYTIPVEFNVNKNVVSFICGDYDKTKTVFIDPWDSLTHFSGTNKAYDISYDNSGNIYVGGGQPPYQFEKYNSAGHLQWSYTTPWTGGPPDWWGSSTTDVRNGVSYITDGLSGGSGTSVVKINTNGTQLARYNAATNFELWRTAFDYCNNQLVMAGGLNCQAAVMDTNLGGISNVVVMSPNDGLQHDLNMLALDNQGNAYMTSNQSYGDMQFSNVLIKMPLPSLLPINYLVSDNYGFVELTSIIYYPFQSNGSGLNYANGFNGLAVDKNVLITYDGALIKKWNTSTGALENSLTVSANPFSSGGLDIDCQGNFFAGNGNTIKEYDSNLNLLNTYSTGSTVYALKITANNKLYACGNGFVQSMNVSTATSSLYSVSSTNPSSCTASDGTAIVYPSSCTSPPYTYTWSNGQTTQSATGLAVGNYSVVIKSGVCSPRTDIINVPIFESGSSVFVPDAFSPNNDGQNDILYVRGGCINTMDFVIYDRWGNKVFESKNPSVGWDGTYLGLPMNTGTYVWYLLATFNDGSVADKKGSVALVR